MSKCLELIITGVFTLLGVILGFFLTVFYNYILERRRIKAEFVEIKDSILLTKTISLDTLSSKLYELRSFFLRNRKHREKRENKAFFEKWLKDWVVTEQEFLGQLGLAVKPSWGLEKATEFIQDLQKLDP